MACSLLPTRYALGGGRRSTQRPLVPLPERAAAVVTRSADGEAGPSGKHSPSRAGLDAAAANGLCRTLAATAVVYQLAYGMNAARAEDRPWKPRRHFRHMDERLPNAWAEELAEVRVTAQRR